jgi:protoporphyrinogen oxidase
MGRNRIILGAGMTGIAAGFASGLPVFEASDAPGGICSSYYIRPQSQDHMIRAPDDGEAYRFEIGGGHWIFGGDPAVLRFMSTFSPVKKYVRSSSVYFKEKKLYVPYPLQNHLRYFDQGIATQALTEMSSAQGPFRTMKEWLEQSFGSILCDLFFSPFHKLYTSGLYDCIAPQDAYKSPVDLSLAIQGALINTPHVGYNVTFSYPEEDLNTLAQRISANCDVRLGMRVEKIDVHSKEVVFGDGNTFGYDVLISTLPLNKMIQMADLTVEAETDPYTSVLVLNIGAIVGDRCPDDYWLYTPDARSGFHRIGFYSNVDRSFLPASSRKKGDRVCIYAERSYSAGSRPSESEISQYSDKVINELQDWEFIKETEVVDSTWIDVAYTWSWPGSRWKQIACEKLEQYDIYQVGRYGRWAFQGIADSIRDGLLVGSALKGFDGTTRNR